MSKIISLCVKRTITEYVNGSFTTNHPEDVVREWIQSVEDWEEREEIHSGFLETDTEEGWKVLYVNPEENDEDDDDEEHIFDDEIQMWRNQNTEN